MDVDFLITEKCNLSCPRCSVAATLGSVVNSTTALQIAEKLIEAGAHSVDLTGGEPLLHARLSDVVCILRAHDVDTMVQTNGTLLTHDVCSVFDDARLNWLSISLDGHNNRTYGRFRNSPEMFGRVMQGLGLAQQLAATKLRIVTTVSKVNLSDFPPLAEWICSAVCPDLWMVFCFLPFGRGRGFANEVLSESEWKVVTELAFSSARRFNQAVAVEAMFADQNISSPAVPSCRAAEPNPVVEPTGDVYPCCLFRDRALCLGNVLDQNIHDLLSEENVFRSLHMIQTHAVPPPSKIVEHCAWLRRHAGYSMCPFTKILPNSDTRNSSRKIEEGIAFREQKRDSTGSA